MDDKQNIGELIPFREKNGMSSLEIAELTGKEHKNVMRDIRELLDKGVSQLNFEPSSYKQHQPNGGFKSVPCFSLTPTGCLILASGYNPVLREKIINRLLELEAEKKNKMRKQSIAGEPTSKQINAKISWIRGCKSLLRLNENSTLLLLKQVGDPLGLPTPDYTSSNGILRSASELLKKNGRNITAQKFNEAAVAKGYLVELERPAAHGKVKRFKSITEKGKDFGENQVSPHNPKETQPSWYENKFVELLNALGL